MRTVIFSSLALVGALVSVTTAHGDHEEYGQMPIVSGPSEVTNLFERPILEKDTYVPSFAGISTFAHLPYRQCWEEGSADDYDIAVIGTKIFFVYFAFYSSCDDRGKKILLHEINE